MSSKPTPEGARRRQGRPVASGPAVGRDALVDAARNLLEELPPSLVTVASIAREAGVDPALVRYYFGNRENLLVAVVDRMMAGQPEHVGGGTDPVEALTRRVQSTFRFIRSAKFMHRLMVEELGSPKSPEARDKIGALNANAVEFFREVAERDGEQQLDPFDPALLHLLVIGVYDFFMSAEPLVRMLLPETDFKEAAERYEQFVVQLLVKGLRRQPAALPG